MFNDGPDRREKSAALMPLPDPVQTCPYDRIVADEFRFGIGVMRGTSRRHLHDFARQAEDLGYDVVHVPDPLGGPAPFPVMTALAQIPAPPENRIGDTWV